MPANLIEAASIIKNLPVNELIILDQPNSGLICYHAINQYHMKGAVVLRISFIFKFSKIWKSSGKRLQFCAKEFISIL